MSEETQIRDRALLHAITSADREATAEEVVERARQYEKFLRGDVGCSSV